MVGEYDSFSETTSSSTSLLFSDAKEALSSAGLVSPSSAPTSCFEHYEDRICQYEQEIDQLQASLAEASEQLEDAAFTAQIEDMQLACLEEQVASLTGQLNAEKESNTELVVSISILHSNLVSRGQQFQAEQVKSASTINNLVIALAQQQSAAAKRILVHSATQGRQAAAFAQLTEQVKEATEAQKTAEQAIQDTERTSAYLKKELDIAERNKQEAKKAISDKEVEGKKLRMEVERLATQNQVAVSALEPILKVYTSDVSLSLSSSFPTRTDLLFLLLLQLSPLTILAPYIGKLELKDIVDKEGLAKDMRRIEKAFLQESNKIHPDKFAHEAFKGPLTNCWNIITTARDVLLADYKMRIAISNAGPRLQTAITSFLSTDFDTEEGRFAAQMHVLDCYLNKESREWQSQCQNFIGRVSDVGTNTIQIEHMLAHFPRLGWFPTLAQHEELRSSHWPFNDNLMECDEADEKTGNNENDDVGASD